MAVIAVARHYAAGGSAVAERVAARLSWTIVDNEFVDRVAAQAGLPRDEVAEREETTPSLVERLAETLAVSSPEVFLAAASGPPRSRQAERTLVQITEAVIDEAVSRGNALIVGRGAHAYLADREATIHVFVTAARDERVKTAAERLRVSADEAARVVDEKDRQRTRYAKLYYDRDWTDPSHYHLVVNTGRLGLDGAADAIIGAARARLGTQIVDE